MATPAPAPEDMLLPLLDSLRRLDTDAPVPEGAQLSAPQAALLSTVAACPGSSLQALAKSLGLTPPTVSVAVSRLAKAGLLERRPDAQDGRVIRIALTERGETLLGGIVAARRARAARLLAVLAPDERRLLVDLLARVLAGTGDLPPTPSVPQRRRGFAGLLSRLRSIRGPAA